MSKNVAVIFAGGVGSRMNAHAKPKQFLEMHGKPIIIHTIEKFEKAKNIDGIVVVCIENWIDTLKEMLVKFSIKKVVSIVKGGSSGQESIFNGLAEAEKHFPDEDVVVLIHDGVRPLIDEKLINDNIECVKQNGNAITIAKQNETVVLQENNIITSTVDRTRAWIARAPQSFYLKDILSAHYQAIKEKKYDFIDSATMMTYYGATLHTVECSGDNIKITTPTDYYIFRAIIEKDENMQLQ